MLCSCTRVAEITILIESSNARRRQIGVRVINLSTYNSIRLNSCGRPSGSRGKLTTHAHRAEHLTPIEMTTPRRLYLYYFNGRKVVTINKLDIQPHPHPSSLPFEIIIHPSDQPRLHSHKYPLAGFVCCASKHQVIPFPLVIPEVTLVRLRRRRLQPLAIPCLHMAASDVSTA